MKWVFFRSICGTWDRCCWLIAFYCCATILCHRHTNPLKRMQAKAVIFFFSGFLQHLRNDNKKPPLKLILIEPATLLEFFLTFKEKSAAQQRRPCLNVVISSQNSKVVTVLPWPIIRAGSMAISCLTLLFVNSSFHHFIAHLRFNFPVSSRAGRNDGSLPPEDNLQPSCWTATLLVVGHVSLPSLLSNESNVHSKVLSYLTWRSWKASMWAIFSWSQCDLANQGGKSW